MKGHFGPINALALNPDGKRYFSISLVQILELLVSRDSLNS